LAFGYGDLVPAKLYAPVLPADLERMVARLVSDGGEHGAVG
jgi:hypothetical protein